MQTERKQRPIRQQNTKGLGFFGFFSCLERGIACIRPLCFLCFLFLFLSPIPAGMAGKSGYTIVSRRISRSLEILGNTRIALSGEHGRVFNPCVASGLNIPDYRLAISSVRTIPVTPIWRLRFVIVRVVFIEWCCRVSGRHVAFFGRF